MLATHHLRSEVQLKLTVTYVYKLDCMAPTQTEELKCKTPVLAAR